MRTTFYVHDKSAARQSLEVRHPCSTSKCPGMTLVALIVNDDDDNCGNKEDKRVRKKGKQE
jgi:hypothetical protein